jgi:hypothetical protein
LQPFNDKAQVAPAPLDLRRPRSNPRAERDTLDRSPIGRHRQTPGLGVMADGRVSPGFGTAFINAATKIPGGLRSVDALPVVVATARSPKFAHAKTLPSAYEAPCLGYLGLNLQGFRDLGRGCVRLDLPILLDGLLDGFGGGGYTSPTPIDRRIPRPCECRAGQPRGVERQRCHWPVQPVAARTATPIAIATYPNSCPCDSRSRRTTTLTARAIVAY